MSESIHSHGHGHGHGRHGGDGAADLRPLALARGEVLGAMSPLPVVEIGLRECRGLVLARPVVASHDLPPFANSAVDGYAVRVADVARPPTDLPVVEEVAAGSVASRELVDGVAIKVMTGAPLPIGTEAVIKVEDTERHSDTVRLLTSADAGDAVRPAGGDVAEGTTVLQPGERLGPAHLGVLSSLGVAWPAVHRRPVVAIASTGDEIVPPETARLAPGTIRDANRFMLRGLLEELGVVVVDYGIIPDDAVALNRTLGHAADNADAVVTSGGVSMGDYDVVKEELTKLGTVEFWRVAMQPAKPFGFGALGDTPFFGLPGNPVSVVVAFEQYVRPSLLTMMGATRIFRTRVPAPLGHDVSTDPAKTVFLRMVAEQDAAGAWTARSAGGQSSNVLSALAASNAFGVVPVGTATLAAGESVTLELFRQPETRTRAEMPDE